MNILKKTLSAIIAFILLLNIIELNTYATPDTAPQSPVKVAVFLYSTNIPLYLHIKEELENIQQENENKIQFTFFDSNANQGTQNDNISQALNTGPFNLYVITPVSRDIDQLQNSVFKIIESKIPLIMLTPPNPSFAKYLESSPSVMIGGEDSQSGVLQGEFIAETWNSNKELFDRNKDNIMQYAILKGPADDPATLARTKYSIQSINDAGIKTQEIFSIHCGWFKECARTNIESAFLSLAGKVEALIANNDAMAMGAIEALQKYGYNKGDKSKYIPVFGINGVPEAIKLIKQGAMAGTVIQNYPEYAKAIYKVGMNLVSGINPLSGTDYKFDKAGKIIKIPYYRYTK